MIMGEICFANTEILYLIFWLYTLNARKPKATRMPRIEIAKTNQSSTGWTPSNFSSILRPSTGTFPP